MSSWRLLNISFNFRATWCPWIRRNNFSEREYIRAAERGRDWRLFSLEDGEHGRETAENESRFKEESTSDNPS